MFEASQEAEGASTLYLHPDSLPYAMPIPLHFPMQDNDVYAGRRLSVLTGMVSTELSTGEAYVELSSPEEATDVQDSYNRKMLGGRYIE